MTMTMTNAAPNSMERKRVSTTTVIEGIRDLMSRRYDRTSKTQLFDYLALKAHEEHAGQWFEIRTTGPSSVKDELDRFFALHPGSGRPYVNPFGLSQGGLLWLARGYERRGVYTHLYDGRTMSGLVMIQQQPGGGLLVNIPESTARTIAESLGSKVPMEATAAFLLRNERFPDSVNVESLIARFRTLFHLSDVELDDLFVREPGFTVTFDSSEPGDLFDALPQDLRPPSLSGGHAATIEAQGVIDLTPIEVADLVFDEPVLRRARRAIARDKAIAFAGPPGTGKSRLVAKLVDEAQRNPAMFELSKPPKYDIRAAETDWTARTIIGGAYPQSDGTLVFQEGLLLQAIRGDRWLVLDEMNRADLDRVLGPLLTFLAGQNVDLGMTALSMGGKPMSLAWDDRPDSRVVETDERRTYAVGQDWRLLGTYNNVDLGRTFSMGAALSRRWATVPVPPVSPDDLLPTLSEMDGVPYSASSLVYKLYTLHYELLPIGPAPFVDMARFVAGEGARLELVGVPQEEGQALTALQDAYVLHMGPQLRRLSPDRRDEFYERLGEILGSEIVDEITSL